jgi:hypothetical protein
MVVTYALYVAQKSIGYCRQMSYINLPENHIIK